MEYTMIDGTLMMDKDGDMRTTYIHTPASGIYNDRLNNKLKDV